MMKLNTKENLNDGTVALSFDRHEIGHKNSDTKLKYQRPLQESHPDLIDQQIEKILVDKLALVKLSEIFDSAPANKLARSSMPSQIPYITNGDGLSQSVRLSY